MKREISTKVKVVPSGLPTITSIDPPVVAKDFEGSVKVIGTNFDMASFVLIGGLVPRSTFKNDRLIEAELKKNITSVLGTKTVKVHTGSGGVSNEKHLVVQSHDVRTDGNDKYGIAKIGSYRVSVLCDKQQYSRRSISLRDMETVEGSPCKHGQVIFVDDNPLTDLGFYSDTVQGSVLARTVHREFDDIYLILRSERPAYFSWGADEKNRLSWFSIDSAP